MENGGSEKLRDEGCGLLGKGVLGGGSREEVGSWIKALDTHICPFGCFVLVLVAMLNFNHGNQIKLHVLTCETEERQL